MKTIDKQKLDFLSKTFKEYEDKGLIYQGSGITTHTKKCFGAHVQALFGGSALYWECYKTLGLYFGIEECQVVAMLVACGAGHRPISTDSWETDPSIVLERMARMKIPSVNSLIKSQNMHILSKLACSQKATAQNLESVYLIGIARSCDTIVQNLTMNPKTPKKILDRIVETGLYFGHVSKNPNTAGYTLKKIATEVANERTFTYAVRFNLAKHPKTPKYVLKKMIRNERVQYIITAAKKNIETRSKPANNTPDFTTVPLPVAKKAVVLPTVSS